MPGSAKPASTIAESLRSSARGTQGYLDRLEHLNRLGHLSVRDVTRAYEGAFLAYYTGLEAAAAVRHFDAVILRLRKNETVR